MTQENGDKPEKGFADDVFGDATYAAPIPSKREFLSWHKPRKQFVRQYQWCKQIGLLLDDVKPEDGILKYFGLPGVDLLDLRYFHNTICNPNDIKLRFLGFNSGANPKSNEYTELNVSLDEVRRLPRVDPRSEVIFDDFCLVAQDNSIAWKKAEEYGPYDVINLDLCDGFASAAPGMGTNTPYAALNKLISLQAKRKNPWLLFLTTRTGRQDIHEQTYQKLVGVYGENLINCDAFRESSGQLLSIVDDATLAEALKTPNGHLSVFLTGLCKWILKLATSQIPPTKVEIKSTIGYKVDANADHDDLISIALKFVPTFIAGHDPTGLSDTPDNGDIECNLAAKALGRLDKRKCADSILDESPEIYGGVISDIETLLETARYDIDAYRSWIAENTG